MNNYDKSKYKIWNWKNPMMLHWIINPGCAAVELFGVVTPKVMLIEKDKTKGLAERSFVPCPHCDTLHSGLTWSKQNKLHTKNWFGYYCTNCTKIIPPLRNWFSGLMFFLMSPMLKGCKKRWLEKQPARYQNLTFELPNAADFKYEWLKSGLYYGVSMALFMTFMDWMDGKTIDIEYVLISIITWVIMGGLAFGLFMSYFMKSYLPKKNHQRKPQTED